MAIFKSIAVVTIILVIGSCNKVKYPENSAKINHPEKLGLMRGFITAYSVNGIDSLDLLNSYCVDDSASAKKIIQNIDFQQEDERHKNEVLNTNFGKIVYQWNNDYKYIFIEHYPFANVISRNIFLINGSNWEIRKLVKAKTDHNQLIIKTEINGNIYEIQFN